MLKTAIFLFVLNLNIPLLIVLPTVTSDLQNQNRETAVKMEVSIKFDDEVFATPSFTVIGNDEATVISNGAHKYKLRTRVKELNNASSAPTKDKNLQVTMILDVFDEATLSWRTISTPGFTARANGIPVILKTDILNQNLKALFGNSLVNSLTVEVKMNEQ